MRIAILQALVLGLLASSAFAEDFDVCVNPVTDFRPDGAGFVAVGVITPGGTIPDGGDPGCLTTASARIGTFFTRGSFVTGLPTAEAEDLAYVDWHFRIDGLGAFDTTGPVRTAETYPQTIVGGTGEFLTATGAATTTVLDGVGFQFRVSIPERRGRPR